MTPEEHAAQSRRMEDKLDKLVTQVTRMETYQKTHYKKLEDHDAKLGHVEERIGKNERNLARASGGLSLIIIVVTAWLGDFFKRGGS